jgi:membrane fusion protein (multidrug efflux system)
MNGDKRTVRGARCAVCGNDAETPRTTHRRPRTAHRRTLVALAALAFATAACRRGNDANAAGLADSSVTIGSENMATAERSQLRSGPSLSGSLQPEREATVRAEVSGRVVQTYVEQGQPVSRGTLLARIDDTSIREQYLSARSGLRSAESAADVAKRELERATKLAEAGAIAERDLEAARRANIGAEAQLADARARLAGAEKLLSSTQVRAPFAGVVSVRSVSGGDVAQPGTALFTVVDPSSMRLEASVPAEQLSSLRVGAPAEFSVSAYPGRTFIGRVQRINPTADATGQVPIYVSIPNSGNQLVGGLFAEGRVASETRTGVVVPVTAVDRRGLKPSVVRIKGGRVERVEVDLGLEDDDSERVEVTRGVAVGDTLLLGAAQGITPGTQVKVAGTGDRGPGTSGGSRE